MQLKNRLQLLLQNNNLTSGTTAWVANDLQGAA
jgi:hypothetical protein